ncbi:MAG TPA: lipoyl synthase [Phycisphaerae bacterium]|nr:lipoyl synthase [Phycisphaerae bacterium]
MELNVLDAPPPSGRRLPAWLKRPLPTGDVLLQTREIVARSGVATVCEEARCPNLSECWSHKHATFMILGDLCTRRCHFCAVITAKPKAPAADEPARLATAVAELGLKHVVITAVARDDLPDEGAGHFAACIREVRAKSPDCAIEILPADFHARDDCLRTVCDAQPDIYNHNQETVERLSPSIRPAARYGRTLDVLRKAKQMLPQVFTKSGLMVGLGETRDELNQTMQDLRDVDVDILTVGQYLRPSEKHAPVVRYYRPEEFDEIAVGARGMGFRAVASGPFVRSSYNAADVYDAIKERRGR